MLSYARDGVSGEPSLELLPHLSCTHILCDSCDISPESEASDHVPTSAPVKPPYNTTEASTVPVGIFMGVAPWLPSSTDF